MTKGITEAQVHAVANALRSAGETPSAERIRDYLGTGSLNAITRWLSSWRQAQPTSHISTPTPPGFPVEITALMAQWWARIWQQAHESARSEIIAEHAQLARQRQVLDSERENFQHIQERHQQALAEAESLLSDVQKLIAQQTAQILELTQQRDTLEMRNKQLESAVVEVSSRLD